MRDTHSLPEGIRGYYGQSEFSDLTIRCGTRQWSVHKIIVCSQSDFFHKAVQGGYKESLEGVVELHEDDAECVEAMIQWFYQGDYEYARSVRPAFHLEVFQLADKYCISRLKDNAHGCFTDDMWHHFTSSWLWDTEKYGEAVNALYDMDTTMSATLREGLIAPMTLNWHWAGRGKSGSFLQTVMRQAPADFAADIIKSLGERTAQGKASGGSASNDDESDDSDDMSDS